MSPETTRFFGKNAKPAHQAGKRDARPSHPIWRKLATLGMVGLIGLGAMGISAQPAHAYNFSTPTNTAISISVMNANNQAAIRSSQERKAAEHLGVERADLKIAVRAADIQAQEQGLDGWSYDSRDEVQLDLSRIADFVDARHHESAQRDQADTLQEQWKFDSWTEQAEAQGLGGWSDDGFVEDAATTAADIADSHEQHENEKMFMRIALGTAGLGGLGMAGVHLNATRRRKQREEEREAERRNNGPTYRI